PGLLLLDEPTANLDPEGVGEVRDAVGRVVESTGATLVVVEHRVDVWLPLVTRVIVLAPDGGLLADGTPDEVFAVRGAELAERGVWVPGHPPAVPTRARTVGAELLAARDLTVGRDSVARSGLQLEVDSGAVT